MYWPTAIHDTILCIHLILMQSTYSLVSLHCTLCQNLGKPLNLVFVIHGNDTTRTQDERDHSAHDGTSKSRI